jgi:FSR family fosmidomycin resistance protein-like MFS transporter
MNSDAPAIRLLIVLIASHFLIDAVATVINPLWPALQAQTASGDLEFLWLFLAWNVATSVTQIGFGLLGDRACGRWLIWAGPVLSAACLSVIGFVPSLFGLCLLATAAGLGVAAFHPEAAFLAGNCLPSRRSRALALFQLGGFFGQTVGPYYSGQLVDRWGMAGLLPGVLWTTIVLAAIRPALRARHSLAPHAPVATGRLDDLLRGQVARLTLLLAIGVLRIIPAAGVPMALAFLESARDSSTADIGLVQSAFTFGIGGGGLYCGLFMAHHHERLILWLLPLCAAPIIALLPGLNGWGLLAASAGGGLLLGSTIPILISLGQQLLPRSQRLGSSITMGLSWGLGGGLAGLVVMGLKPSGRIDQAFPLFAVAAVLSSLACGWLPRLEHAAESPLGNSAPTP